MSDQKQREVRMNARKKGGNPPRMHRRVHKQVKREVWKRMQFRYQTERRDARLAVLVKMPEERWHESEKQEFEKALI